MPKYAHTVVDGISIYYPPKLQVKQGADCITIRLKKFLFLSWLEVDGVKGRAVISE